jgi:hypothetical protein
VDQRPFHRLLGSECSLQAKGAPSALSRHIVGRPPGLAQQRDVCVLQFGPLGENVPVADLLGHVPDDRLHAPNPFTSCDESSLVSEAPSLSRQRLQSLGPDGEAGPAHRAFDLVVVPHQRWTKVANRKALSSLVSEDTHGQTAGMVHETYDRVDLADFVVQVIDYQAAAVCEVDTELVLGGESRPVRIRWIRKGADGMAALPNQAGQWRLILWTPMAMLNRARERLQSPTVD